MTSFVLCEYIVRPKTSSIILTSLRVTGPHRSSHEFSFFCQICAPITQQERTPIILVPWAPQPAAPYSVPTSWFSLPVGPWIIQTSQPQPPVRTEAHLDLLSPQAQLPPPLGVHSSWVQPLMAVSNTRRMWVCMTKKLPVFSVQCHVLHAWLISPV